MSSAELNAVSLPTHEPDGSVVVEEVTDVVHNKHANMLEKRTSDGRIISKIRQAAEEKRPFYSFEYFPPKTDAGVLNLYARLDRMSTLEPLFCDVTWGAGGTTSDLTLEISANAQNYSSPEVMMHLTCTNLPVSAVREALVKAKNAGIRNILALRGDPPRGAETWEACDDGFAHAVDLVRFIRREFGDFFGIGVAGYPEGHISATSLDDDVKYLKEKMDAGADFIITQLFYDVDLFNQWVEKCHAIGITQPIIPGIMPIQTYQGFKRMTGFCKTYVPPEIEAALEPIKHDDAAVKEYGIKLGIEMSEKLLASGVPGLHFYTLNLERSVVNILMGLGFVVRHKPDKKRAVPWQQSKLSRRDQESVRPIFWANRPKSYLTRTTTWDEFPNGRWGDSRSPAFGDLSDYHLCSFKTGPAADRRAMWGENPSTIDDITRVFVGYIEGKIDRLPWFEEKLHAETSPLVEKLLTLNKHGYLTINSQPRVNGAPSTDPVVGWGGEGGVVYQKAYLELFLSREKLDQLIEILADFPSLAYTATDYKGDCKTNIPDSHKGAIAVTWGVFPNKEIMQPTVADRHSFMVWKDEAFALWESQWMAIYESGSDAAKLLKSVHDTFFLVNIVDNDFVNGDIFAPFNRLMNNESA
jgi:methylenetetrahydrofolate reductase